MFKVCRSATALYRLPRISLNLRLDGPVISSTSSLSWTHTNMARNYSQKPPSGPGLSGARIYGGKHSENEDDQPRSIVEILEREIQEESAELNQHLATDQFPGFSVETDDADVLLTKKSGNATVSVRFTVSSSLNEWTSADRDTTQTQDENAEDLAETLLSMPDFQVQITKANKTLEMSCYFEELDRDPETGENYGPAHPTFCIDELVIYDNQPKETVFAVSAEYFEEDLQSALLEYLARHGIDEEFTKNLVRFATSYEKKQYIGLMRQLKNFVADDM